MRNRGSASVSVSLKTMDLGCYLALVRFDQQQSIGLDFLIAVSPLFARLQ